ncbi:MAG: hypothetical protein J6B26_05985, partial [Agathobacter sp.]|nr:hypothetical protein [Agathobacter sp.]
AVAQETVAQQATETVAQETVAQQATETVAQETVAQQAAETVAQEAVAQQVAEAVAQEAVAQQVAEAVAQETVVQQVAEAVAQEAVAQQVAEAVGQEEVAQQVAEAVAQEAVAQQGTQAAPQPGMAQNGTPVWNGAPVVEKEKKKPSKLIFAIIGGAAVIFLLAVVCAVFIFSQIFSQGSDRYAVYIKGDKIMYTNDVTKDKEAMEICEVRADSSDYWYYYAVQLTEDNKYVYFYDKVDSSGTGRLCRIETKKISSNTDKNEKNIEEISSNVISYSVLEDSDQVIFRKENGRLVFLDGKKEIDVDSNVTSFYVDTEHNTILYSKDQDEMELCVYNIKSGESEEIDSEISYINYMSDSDFILYSKDESEDGDGTLYVANGKGEIKEIAEDAFFEAFDAETGNIYYLQKEENSVSLYSYVNDTYAEGDASLTQPETKNYLSGATEQDAMSEYDYNYYVVEHPEYKDNYYNWLSYDSNVGLYYTYKYSENDLGEYQSELFFYDSTLQQWYRYDQAAFTKDYEAYEDAADRIELRAELKEENYEWTSYNLYCYEKGGDSVLVAENIDRYSTTVDAKSQIAIYERMDISEVEKVSIDEIYGTYSVRERIEESMDNEGEWYYRVAAGEENELDVEGAFGEIDISDNCKNVVISSDYTESGSILTLFEVKNNQLEKKEEISDSAQAACWVDNKFYYYKDVDDNYNGDLCYYQNGKNEKLIKNIYVGMVKLYSGDQYLCMSDYSYGGADLKVYDSKGESEKIASSVSNYTYIEKDCILYIKDSDLYAYIGKDESLKLERNITTYFCKSAEGTDIY